jgi:hypothetical protein
VVRNKYPMQIGELLNERALRVEINNQSMVVHKNPPSQTLLTLWDNSAYGIMRGIIEGPDVYWWDADKAIHAQVAAVLGLEPLSSDHSEEEEDDPRRLILSREGDGRPFLSFSKTHRDHPQLQKLLRVPTVVSE